MNRNTAIRFLEIFIRDHQVRKAVINQGTKTMAGLVTTCNSYADQLAYEIARHEFAREQRNK
jgi:hypothetical protein